MTVHVDKVGDRIWVRSERALYGLHQSIPGANFSKVNGPHWSAPLGMDTCALLREKFGAELVIGQDLWAWAAKQKADQRHMEELKSGAIVPALGDWADQYPKLYRAVTKGRPYQAVAAKWIGNGERRGVLIGDTVGLGKTVQALAGIVESGIPGPHLVICPKTAVESVWRADIAAYLPDAGIITVPDGRAKRDAILTGLVNLDRMNAESRARDVESLMPLSNTFVVVHPEMVRTKSWWICKECGSETLITSKPKELVCDHDTKRTTTRHDHEFPQLFQIEYGVIVADESDKSIIRLTGTPTQTRRGMEMVRDLAQLPVAQTGTPWRSRPKLLWSTLNWLRPDEFPAFWRWAEIYFDVSEGYGGSRVIGRLRPEREEMLWKSLNRIMLRRTRAEVASHLPEKHIINVWLPMDATQSKAHERMRATSTAEVEGGRLDAIGILAEMTRLKQFATSAGRIDGDAFHPALPSNKFDWLVEHLVELGYPDDPQMKLIIASQFTEVLEMMDREISRLFKTDSLTAQLTGKVTGRRRAEIIDEFNDEESGPYLLFLNTKAGGSAITLDAADGMVILDETWIPDDITQLMGRNDNRRPETKIQQRVYWFLRSVDSIEEWIAQVNEERDQESARVLDGARLGVEFARAVLKKGEAAR